MEKLTGGRSAFWAIDFEKYLELNPFYLVFGKGFDFPYFVNQTYYNGMRIWCHNDFLDCLLSGGLLCFLVYIYIVFKNIFSLKDSKILMTFLGLYYLFVAFINGLFGYQHYLLSYIMLYIVVRCDFNKQEGKKQEDYRQ